MIEASQSRLEKKEERLLLSRAAIDEGATPSGLKLEEDEESGRASGRLFFVIRLIVKRGLWADIHLRLG